MPDLTEEQRKIVAHDHGPALVFAVAGAGKTTAMTWRIERLVREGISPAQALLATSFSKASVGDIKKALGRWPGCEAVQVQTLHSVGWGIIKLAGRRGHLPGLTLAQDEDGAEGRILSLTLAQARREGAAYAPELETLDRQDFQTYVGVMKANLRYPDLARAGLPPSALAQAGEATAPPGLEWYRDLYGLFERVRQAENALTFDDMPLLGWECLHRFPDVLAEMRSRFQCILVDEFQDVNRVQFEMLDLLTLPHRNYMAIGDDDQTIYEWRGADPGFILGFAARYGAATFFIHDNFRSHAAPLALANRVIAHNTQRQPKRLSLTRGFGGDLQIHEEDSPAAQSRHLAQIVRREWDAGRPLSDMVILVRLYAQTPSLEQALLAEGIPYRIVGSSPFYARPEIVTLLDYLRLAQAERSGFSTDGEWEARWRRIANKPVRYLPRPLCDAVAQAIRQGRPLTQALTDAARDAPDRLASRLLNLADTFRWLAGALATLPASAALTGLDAKIGYRDYLSSSSGFPETGAARAEGVETFLRYAESLPTPDALLAHLDILAAQGIGQNRAEASESLALMTVFRAKGLQWPVVFVPDCNQGTFPYGGPDEIEEERRLFYVALTRPQSALHLHLLKTAPPSQFLREADCAQTLDMVRQMAATLGRDPDAWQTGETLALARHTEGLGWERYWERWQAPPALARRIASRMAALFGEARRLGLIQPLGLAPSQGDLWARLAPPSEPGGAGFPDLADHAPQSPDQLAGDPTPAPEPAEGGPLRVGGHVEHTQHGLGTILAIRGDRLSPRLEIQFARGKPVILPAKFVTPIVPSAR